MANRFIKHITIMAVVCIFIFSAQKALANALSITSFGPASAAETKTKTLLFNFSINWQNCWRTGINHDAAWVFLKYFNPLINQWQHATLRSNGFNPQGTSRDQTNFDIIIPQDRKGFFVQRSEASFGSGSCNFSGTFTWDYGHDKISSFDSPGWDFRLFAIEMVYIPEGSFVAMGPGGSSTASSPLGGLSIHPFGRIDNISSSEVNFTKWWDVKSESALTILSPEHIGPASTIAEGSLFDQTAGPYTIPTAFPKGYQPFYLMKYEITQGQYRDFLNTLTKSDGLARCAAASVGRFCDSSGTYSTTANIYRQAIKLISTTTLQTSTVRRYGCDLNNNQIPNEQDDGEWIAANYLSWADLAAYLDWAALRPMTELEFEKASRGSSQASGNLWVWGTDTPCPANSALLDPNTPLERPDCVGCCKNIQDDAYPGPIRTGAFAAIGNTRLSTGAGYYGLHDLCGNVKEQTVSLIPSNGKILFTGSHGDGALTSGYANKPDWPGYNENLGIVESDFNVTVRRGGGFEAPSTGPEAPYIFTRDTLYGGSPTGRDKEYGGRGARTAPSF